MMNKILMMIACVFAMVGCHSTSMIHNESTKVGDSDLYMVIDLSGGATATNYPVSFLANVPKNGWTDDYKTTKLVLRRIKLEKCNVSIDKPYYIGVFAVTQKQYALITGKTPSKFSGNDMRPVEYVSYNMIRGARKGAQYPSSQEVDSDSIIGRLRTRTGMCFDLPTVAQWEYACRAGSTTAFSYGDKENGDYMWYLPNAGSRTHDVGTCKPNTWGIYDMHGNIWEWCLEWVEKTSARAIRGGSWKYTAEYCTSSHPRYSFPSNRYDDLGFRLSCQGPMTNVAH